MNSSTNKNRILHNKIQHSNMYFGVALYDSQVTTNKE